ncbi:MAG: ABC transporter permease subunit [Deltaproteobacteria bacterium]|nr:ABC transporter permease subunit [Deltaproteobacteria bacterium]
MQSAIPKRGRGSEARSGHPGGWLGKKVVSGREGLLFALAIVVLWQGIAILTQKKLGFLFPPLAVVGKALWVSLPELLRGTWSSLLILAPGYLFAVAAGVAAGIVVATTGWLSRAFLPFARVVAPVPPTIYIPYAIALIATFRGASIFVVFVGAFWPIFLNTAAGAAAVPARYRDDARILGLSRFDTLRKVILPASLPHSFSGMAVGLSLAFILLTVAELFGANAGLGRFVQYYADYADYPRMVAGIVYTGLITFLAMEILERIKKRALFWVR